MGHISISFDTTFHGFGVFSALFECYDLDYKSKLEGGIFLSAACDFHKNLKVPCFDIGMACTWGA